MMKFSKNIFSKEHFYVKENKKTFEILKILYFQNRILKINKLFNKSCAKITPYYGILYKIGKECT